jgi:hypothetical protein
LKNVGDDESVRRFFGNFTANYEINSWSNISYRLALDNYTQTKNIMSTEEMDSLSTMKVI